MKTHFDQHKSTAKKLKPAQPFSKKKEKAKPNSLFGPLENRPLTPSSFSPEPIMEQAALSKEKVNTNEETTFKSADYTIDDPAAVIRDKNNKWAPITYKKGDADLPTKVTKEKKTVPDESFIGKSKTIPDGTKVKIDDVHIQVNSSKTVNDKLKYVHVVDYGWTSVGNISGGLKNESVGVMEAVKPKSTQPNHYTVGVKDAVVLKEGNRYLEYDDKKKIALNAVVDVENTFKGYYGNNKSRNLAKVKVGGNITYTSKGNYSSKAHDKKEPNKRKITDGAAYERREVSSYIPKDKVTMALGKFVIIGSDSVKDTGTYVEVFEPTEKKEGDQTTYSKGKSLGWTNKLNLTEGFHTDLKGLNAKWDQVIPDERYDRAKGKDTEGTAKFTGNQDMIKIVDSKGDIEYVAKEIWGGLKRMLDAANSAGQGLQVNTGFRDWDYQQAMVDDPRFAANPAGFSSHQIGIAVDLNNKKDIKEGGRNDWMERNAYKFGFVRTYQKYKEGHHWEYRPNEVTAPVEIEKDGKKYMKYTFATFDSESTSIWDRNHVLDEIPAEDKSKKK